MQSLRNNHRWLAVMLVLAMVFTMGGLPATALACASPSGLLPVTALAPERAQGASCQGAEGAGACCCGPKAAPSAGSETGSQ